MSDELWRRDEVESPCVRVCVIDPSSQLCLGCHRSIDEIATWSRLDPAARRVIVAELPARAARTAPVRRGGRKARIARSD